MTRVFKKEFGDIGRDLKLTKVKMNVRVTFPSVSISVALSGSQDPDILVMFGCRFKTS